MYSREEEKICFGHPLIPGMSYTSPRPAYLRHNNVNSQPTARRINTELRYYQARWPACCIMLGEIDDGGLMRVRVSGLTIGIGLRDRMADGW